MGVCFGTLVAWVAHLTGNELRAELESSTCEGYYEGRHCTNFLQTPTITASVNGDASKKP